MNQGLPWGSCRAPKHQQQTNLLASHCQEACIHADAWIHAASSAALQLPWWRTSLSNDRVAQGTRESKQIFLVQLKAHQFKLPQSNKTIPTNPLWLVTFFEQCQTANKAASVLDKLKEKKLLKEKRTDHLPVACCQGLNHRHHYRKNSNHHLRDWRNHNKCRHDSCHWNDRRKDHPCCKDKDKKNSYKKRDDCNVITLKWRKRLCTTTIPSPWAWTLCPEKGVAPYQGLLLAHAPVLVLAQAGTKGAIWNIMSSMMTAREAVPSSKVICTWTMRTTDKFTVQQKEDSGFATFAAPKG